MKHFLVILLVTFLSACGEETVNNTGKKEESTEKSESNEATYPLAENNLDTLVAMVEEEEVPFSQYPYEGELDGEKIYMQLTFDMNDLSGKYIDENGEHIKKLKGSYTENGFVLEESSSNGDVTGYFIAEGDFLNFNGFWIKPDQIKEAPVSISYGYHDRRLKGSIDAVTADNKDFDWYNFVPSLDSSCSECISIQHATKKNTYLRHQNYILKLQEYDSSALFKKDASFKLVEGLSDESKVSFQSLNFPNLYLRLMGSKLELRHDRYVTNMASTFSLVYDYSRISNQNTKFSVKARYHSYDETPEGVDLLHGRITRASGTFVSYELGGDTPHIVFRKDGGTTEYYDGNRDENYELFRDLSDEEMKMDEHQYSQGYTTNERYIGVPFTIFWAETYKHVESFDSRFGKVRIIYRLEEI